MEQYFQREGRDWERYAWIKARPVAGDRVIRDRMRKLTLLLGLSAMVAMTSVALGADPKSKKADRKKLYTERARAALKDWLASTELEPA